MAFRTSSVVCALLLLFSPRPVLAQLEILTNDPAQTVFSGEARRIRVTFHNPSDRTLETSLRTQLYQASSATVVPLGKPQPWKKLGLLPGQTVLESISVDIPAVRAETRFLVQWLDDAAKVLGTTEVFGYPPDLLKDLKPLAAKRPLGILDPENHLKPLLKSAAVEIVNLQENALEDFPGNLVILGPFRDEAQMANGLVNRIEALAKRGVAVIWIQPPPEKRSTKIKPSFHLATQGKGAIVVVQPGLVPDLQNNPQSQLNLLQFAGLALHPEPFPLPHLTH